MRALKPFMTSQGSGLADYASRLGDALARQRADLEARAARAEAEIAIKSRSEFLANMNHELRTPLNAIIGFATMLRDGEEFELGEEQRRSYAEYILQSADLLLGHINTLLDVAALESGKVEIEDEAIDVSAILAEAIDRARTRASAAEVSIERLDECGPVHGWGDPQRLGQAIDHLLQTAIKMSSKGGRILVRAATAKSDWAEIAIRDEGDGLDKEALYGALDIFKETLRGLDRSWMGPGVGYAIAKTFLEMQGGCFSIDSRVGEGTLVQISLPPAAAVTRGSEETESHDGHEQPAEKQHGAA